MNSLLFPLQKFMPHNYAQVEKDPEWKCKRLQKLQMIVIPIILNQKEEQETL